MEITKESLVELINQSHNGAHKTILDKVVELKTEVLIQIASLKSKRESQSDMCSERKADIQENRDSIKAIKAWMITGLAVVSVELAILIFTLIFILINGGS